MEKNLYLGVDIGTYETKRFLVNQIGEILAQSFKKHELIVPQKGWVGAAATYFLVDPKNDLTAVLMTQVLGAENTLNKNFVKAIYQNLN